MVAVGRSKTADIFKDDRAVPSSMVSRERLEWQEFKANQDLSGWLDTGVFLSAHAGCGAEHAWICPNGVSSAEDSKSELGVLRLQCYLQLAANFSGNSRKLPQAPGFRSRDEGA